MLDYNEVAMFVAVAEAGSFVQASKRLGVPPNSLSRRIQHLEDKLGVRLLRRTTRKLSLTDAGNKFFRSCNGPVTAVGAAQRALLDQADTPSGSLRVAAPADFFTTFRLEWISEFLSDHVGASLEFLLSDETADLVTEQIDVALRSGRLPDSSLVARRLGPIHLILVASPGYLEKRGAPTALLDLATHECLTAPCPGERLAWRLEGPSGDETVHVTGRFAASTVSALHQAAIAGLGIALLPAIRLTRDVEEGRLRVVLPNYRRDHGGLFAVFPTRLQLPLLASAFVDFVAERFASFSS